MLTRSLSQWFQFTLAQLRKQPSRRRRAALRAELLESRVVLATFVVNTTVDTVDAIVGDGLAQDANGNTSLRAAIMEANFTTEADTIQLPAGVHQISLAEPLGEFRVISTSNFGGDFDIETPIRIEGVSAATSIIDANQIDRLFDVVSTGSLELSQVTLRNGLSDIGGAIRSSAGSVDIRDSVLSNNRAVIRGGAIEMQGVTGNVLGVYNTTLSNNLANGVANPATPNGNGIGGAISLSGSMQATLSQAIITNSMAAGEGGAWMPVRSAV
jgi:hypothetical protein